MIRMMCVIQSNYVTMAVPDKVMGLSAIISMATVRNKEKGWERRESSKVGRLAIGMTRNSSWSCDETCRQESERKF